METTVMVAVTRGNPQILGPSFAPTQAMIEP